MSTREVGYIAVYVLRLVKQSVQGCGGRTHIVEVQNRKEPVREIPWGKEATKRIEKDYKILQAAIKPVICAYPNLSLDDKKFQDVLKQLKQILGKRRSKNLRRQKKELKAVGLA